MDTHLADFKILTPEQIKHIISLECIGKPYLLKAQLCAFNTSDSTTIPLTVQNWQITSYVPVSTQNITQIFVFFSSVPVSNKLPDHLNLPLFDDMLQV